MEIKIYNHSIKVVESNPSDWSNGMGRSNTLKGEILLNKTLPEDMKLNTLLHEVLHFILDIHSLKLSDNETAVSLIATGMIDFLRSNPDIAKRIIRRVK